MVGLLCTLPVVQFVVDAFQDYVRLTDISSILNVQVRNMDFFGVIFKNNIFISATHSLGGLFGSAPNDPPESVGVRFDGGAIMSSGRRVVVGSGRRSAGGVGAYAAKSSRAVEGGAGRSPQTFLPTTRRQTKASRHCWIASPLPTG